MENSYSQPVESIPLSDDCSVVKIHLHECMDALKDDSGRPKSRELALAVTKLQEATMWIDEHLRLA